MASKLPQYLYKYRRVDADALAMLASNQLYLSRIDAFNDPFEFLDLEATMHSASLWNQTPSTAKASKEYCDEQFRSSIRVCALSQECRDLLMWGHYGDRHRGFCLRFEFQHDEKVLKKLFPVDYRPTLPELSQEPKDAMGIARISTLTKSDKWSYEQEWRIIDHVAEDEAETAELFMPYQPAALTGIIFGVRTPKLHKTLIRKLVREQPNLKFYQAEKRRDQFALEIVESSEEDDADESKDSK